MPLRDSLARWIARYGVAEAIGTCTALGGAAAAHALTGNEVAAAYGGALGENVGYYGFILSRELLGAHRTARASGAVLDGRQVLVLGREMAIEFGPAELLDTALVRPLTMGIGTRLLGGGIGVLAGKVAADLLFYLPVVFTHEMRRNRRASPPG